MCNCKFNWCLINGRHDHTCVILMNSEWKENVMLTYIRDQNRTVDDATYSGVDRIWNLPKCKNLPKTTCLCVCALLYDGCLVSYMSLCRPVAITGTWVYVFVLNYTCVCVIQNKHIDPCACGRYLAFQKEAR